MRAALLVSCVVLVLPIAALAQPPAPPPFLLKWGSGGNDPGEFDLPKAAAFDHSGHVYVADEGNYRIAKFTTTGSFMTQWGVNGHGNGQFECVQGVAVADGFVYTADDCDDRVQKFTTNGVYVGQWGQSGDGDGEFSGARAVAIQVDSTILVADGGNGRIQRFSPSGAFLSKFGTEGSGTGQLLNPSGVAVDDSGNVYVTSEGRHKVVKFASDGTFLIEWGSLGTGTGQFNRPMSVAVDDNGRVFVGDFVNHRIQVFSRVGGYLTAWGTEGTATGQFRAPWGVAVDDSAHIFVADMLNRRMQKFSYADLDGDGLLDGWELNGVDADGNYVSDYTLPGADAMHKDLYVEVDAMAGLAPAPGALNSVVAAFAAAPVSNPDGVDGIRLHIPGPCDPCTDEGSLVARPWNNTWASFDSTKDIEFGTSVERALPNWAQVRQAKAMAFRYCIFAHSYLFNGSSRRTGLAEVIGNDFMVTLGNYVPVTAEEQAGTFMHELGHTLGLLHGGRDTVKYKPNYRSVMNYTWLMPNRVLLTGVAARALNRYRNSWVLDYSRDSLPSLDETSLSEPAGIGGNANVWVPVGPGSGGPNTAQIVPMAGPVNWNRNGTKSNVGVVADANYLPGQSDASPGETLRGAEDWQGLLYLPRTVATWSDLRNPGPDQEFRVQVDDDVDEMTAEAFEALSSLRFDCNGNGVFDDDEITAGAPDVDENGVLDACEAITVGVPPPTVSGLLELTIRGSPNLPGAPHVVSFALPAAGPVRVAVFDAAGAQVVSLVDRVLGASRHEVAWHGRDGRGNRVATGVYFVRVTAGRRAEVARLIHLN